MVVQLLPVSHRCCLVDRLLGLPAQPCDVSHPAMRAGRPPGTRLLAGSSSASSAAAGHSLRTSPSQGSTCQRSPCRMREDRRHRVGGPATRLPISTLALRMTDGCSRRFPRSASSASRSQEGGRHRPATMSTPGHRVSVADADPTGHECQSCLPAAVPADWRHRALRRQWVPRPRSAPSGSSEGTTSCGPLSCMFARVDLYRSLVCGAGGRNRQ